MKESILTSVKKAMGGIPEDYEGFDADLILFINSELSKLCQLGVGPSEGFEIKSKAETWDQFVNDKRLNMVKEYIVLKVKISFDNTTVPSTVLNMYQDKTAELEWRLNVLAEQLNEE